MTPFAELDAKKLLELVKSEGYNAALMILHRALRESPIHGTLMKTVETATSQTPAVPADITVAIVPGALYKERPNTGAGGENFVDILRNLGIKTVCVPTKSLGTLQENGRLITEWLTAQTAQNLVLVSFSKGGADVKTALADSNSHSAFRHVKGWISAGGILHGTPLIGWLKRRPLRFFVVRQMLRWKGLPLEALLEADHGPGTPLDGPINLPPHLRLIHLIAFPTAADLSISLAHRAFRRLSPLGLNDGGGLLLGDLQRFPGEIYPLLRADHYLRNCPDLPGILAALVTIAATPLTRS